MSVKSVWSPAAAAYLDALRALAACVVVLGHVQGLFFVDVPTAHTVFSKLFYSLAARSHDAVIVFFVLSGLLITRSAANVCMHRTGTWRTYASARIARLYTVLVPALLLGAAWDYAGLMQFGEAYHSDAIIVAERLNVLSFLGNLAFLQTIFVTPFGSNEPLWSLAYEGWYYVMFPLCVIVCVRSARWVHRVVAIGLLGIIALCVGWKILGYYVIWLMGAALYFFPAAPYDSKWRFRLWGGASVVLVLAVIFIARKKLFPADEAGLAPDMLVAGAVALHVRVMLARTGMPNAWFAACAARLAAFSYTLYLCHFPFLLFLFYAMLGGQPCQPGALQLGYGTGIFLLTMLYGVCIGQLFEARTKQVQAHISRLFVFFVRAA